MSQPKSLSELADHHMSLAENGTTEAKQAEQRRKDLQKAVAGAMLKTAKEALDLLQDKGIEPDITRPEGADEVMPEKAWALTAERRYVVRKGEGGRYTEYKGYAVSKDGRLVRYRKQAPLPSSNFKHGAPKRTTYFEPCEIPEVGETTIIDYVHPDGFTPPERIDPEQPDIYAQQVFQDWHSRLLGTVVKRQADI